MREIDDNQSGLAGAEIVQAIEQSLAVVEFAQRVRDQDHVEGSRQRLEQSVLLDIADGEGKVRVLPARFRDHRSAEVDTNAQRRFERRQQMTVAAAEIENPRSYRDHGL